MRKKSFVLILYMMVFGVFCIVCVDAVRFFHIGTDGVQQEKMIEMNEGWILQQNNSLKHIKQLPKVFFDETHQITIFRQLPQDLKSESVLIFRNRFQDVQVQIDGQERYSHSGLLPGHKRRADSNIYCKVSLEKEDSGKQIEVFFQNPLVNSSLYLPHFYIGTETGVFLKLFRGDVASLIVSGIMIFFAVLFFAMSIREKIGKGTNFGVFAHIAGLMTLSSIWSITNIPMVHFAVNNDAFLNFLSFNSFMLLPVAIPMFYRGVLEGQDRLLNQLAGIASINFIVQNILYFAGGFQYIEMTPITYIISFLSIFALVGISFQRHRKGNSYYVTGFLISTILFLGFYIMDVLQFFYNTPVDNAIFFRYGILTFLIIILWICAKRMLSYVEVEVENRVYKELAL